jgi:parallel beta-helix repeat protein
MTPASRRSGAAPRPAATALRLLAAALLGLAGLVPVAATPAAATHAGTTYFVDAAGGDDGAAGTAPWSAWRTLGRVDATAFRPGDRILLHAGQGWTGQLWPKGSGAPGHPITIGRYGAGAKPAVDGAGTVADAVHLHDQQYWDIRDLRVSNANPPGDGAPGTNLRDLRGIGIDGDTGGTLRHLHVEDVDVHDVTGEVNWISGDTAGNQPGVTFRTGWDRSKDTGGIVFRGLAADPAAPGSPTTFDDILVAHSTVLATSFAGIVVKQHTGNDAVHTGWGERATADDPAFAPHTHVVIRDDYVDQSGSPYACNGVYLTDTRGGLIEGNVVHRAGTSGIELYYADGITVRHNEVYGTEQKAGGADSNGIDADNATTGILVQDNFVHDNGDGVLLCQCGKNFGDVRVRYNVLSDNRRYQIYLHSNPGTTAYVYDNTVYDGTSDYLVYGYGGNLRATYHLWNNVLYATRPGASLTTSPTIDYTANLYGGAALPVPATDTAAVVGDPLFAGTVTGPYGTARSGPRLDRALALRPTAASPAIDAGIPVPDNGGHDYTGVPLYQGPPDLGAFERAGRA